MSQPNVPEHDLVDKLLSIEGPTGVDRMRLPLLAQTTSVVRRRRMVRRLGLATALAGCYLAGVVTPWGRKGPPPLQDGPVVQQRVAPDEADRRAVRTSPERRPPGKAGPSQPVEDSERRRAALGRADFEQIRRVSDRYLREQGDLVTALHYYPRALKQASAEERAISVEKDSWLLMALKQAHIEEGPKNVPDA